MTTDEKKELMLGLYRQLESARQGYADAIETLLSECESNLDSIAEKIENNELYKQSSGVHKSTWAYKHNFLSKLKANLEQEPWLV